MNNNNDNINFIDDKYSTIIENQSKLIDHLLKSDDKRNKYEIFKWITNCVMICVIGVTFIICYFCSSYETDNYGDTNITQSDSSILNTKGEMSVNE